MARKGRKGERRKIKDLRGRRKGKEGRSRIYFYFYSYFGLAETCQLCSRISTRWHCDIFYSRTVTTLTRTSETPPVHISCFLWCRFGMCCVYVNNNNKNEPFCLLSRFVLSSFFLLTSLCFFLLLFFDVAVL